MKVENRCSFQLAASLQEPAKVCGKKLKPVDKEIVCRCGLSFCSRHRDVIAHHCPVKPELIQHVARKHLGRHAKEGPTNGVN
jgi:hypothetical protein